MSRKCKYTSEDSTVVVDVVGSKPRKCSSVETCQSLNSLHQIRVTYCTVSGSSGQPSGQHQSRVDNTGCKQTEAGCTDPAEVECTTVQVRVKKGFTLYTVEASSENRRL